MTDNILCSNRKAKHDFEILETIEAGIVLLGYEVKSIRNNKSSLDAAYATVDDGEVWLIGSHVEEYETSSSMTPYDPKRKRKLLLKKKTIQKFAEKAEQNGHTLIPLDFHINNGKIKVTLAVAKGKQKHDKREALKKAEAEKEIRAK